MLPFDWFIYSGLILGRNEFPRNSGERSGVIFCFILDVINTFWTKRTIASGEEFRKIIYFFDFSFIILFFHLRNRIYVFELFTQIKMTRLVLLMKEKKIEPI